jgi:hypothetical protein
MAAVMIKCPLTPHSFSTGLDVDSDEAFHALLDVAYRTDCPLCGNNHVWFKQNAWIADSFEPRQEEVSHCKAASGAVPAAR